MKSAEFAALIRKRGYTKEYVAQLIETHDREVTAKALRDAADSLAARAERWSSAAHTATGNHAAHAAERCWSKEDEANDIANELRLMADRAERGES